MKSVYIRGSRFNLDAVQRLDFFCQRACSPTAWNRHEGIELHYVRKGSIVWEFEDGTPAQTVKGGTLIAIPARTSHRVINGTISPAIRLGIILRAPGAKLNASALDSSEFKFLSDVLAGGTGKVLTASKALLETASRVQSCMRTFDPANRLSVLRLRQATALLLCETAEEFMHPRVKDESACDVRSLAAVINRTPEISLDELLARSGYGRTRFFTLFQQACGTSPCEYINRQRIKKAQRLIRGKNPPPLFQVARQTGFLSAGVFSNVFRRYVGMTPREFAHSLRQPKSRGSMTGVRQASPV